MTKVRQDAWTKNQDELLANTVLEHVRKGQSQLSAFEFVGRQTARTASACGFRWNSFVRKGYENALKQAKAEKNSKANQARKADKAKELEKKLPGYKVLPESEVSSRFKPVAEITYYDVRLSSEELKELKAFMNKASREYKTLPFALKSFREELNSLI